MLLPLLVVGSLFVCLAMPGVHFGSLIVRGPAGRWHRRAIQLLCRMSVRLDPCDQVGGQMSLDSPFKGFEKGVKEFLGATHESPRSQRRARS